ncbi:hypothetical protein FA048_08530 [Pedobacter polaris]|uniref:Uncharacterized protein n=1 Tax=Pedobacter polaris TaxID=2571273 RepID=A0A4V6WN75_9SPHI|nr:hypothetical protein [Pedobacter polaris]TKC10232.1 hypothetical protein FA048_08530 [Pedobacter polaris]
MSRFYLLLLCIIIIACNNLKTTDTKIDSIAIEKNKLPKNQILTINIDSIKREILTLDSSVNDTTVYKFSLDENLSAEGNEGKAFYVDNQIKRLTVTFYGEMGRSVYTYVFKNDKIKIEEKIHEYDIALSGNIKSTKISTYQIDFNGKIISNSGNEIDLDTYFTLKRSIPFTLK